MRVVDERTDRHGPRPTARLDRAIGSRETPCRGGGMPTRFAWASVRALTLAVAALIALAGTRALGQPAPLVSLEPLKLELGQIEATMGREGLGDDDLAELRDRVATARDEIRSRIEAIEPQLADTDARRKQLGDAPEAGAPREDPAIAA